MSNDDAAITDTLEPIGTAAGGLLVVIGLGTIVGMPWQTNGDLIVSIIQLVGILATIAVGAGLVWVSRAAE